MPAGSQLLKTGFVLVSNSLFVYLGTFRAAVSGEVQPDFLHSDLTASAGLLLLGPPVVVLGFVLRLRRRRPREPGGRAPGRRAPGGRPPGRQAPGRRPPDGRGGSWSRARRSS